MQKFTRALTREVEVGGQRLAVTMDADGLTIRPVGSRREPHRLGWAAVAVAATGAAPPGPEQITASLAALSAGAARPKGEAPALAPALSAPTESAPLADVLACLDAWLARHRPRYHAALEPGATAAQLAELEGRLGRPMPAEVRTWLGWHNGQKGGFHGAFVEAFLLLGTEGVAAVARSFREEELVAGWNDAWVPLLADDQGNAIVLDPTAEGRPLREVWRGNDVHAVRARSLADWAEGLLADFEANRYVEDPERGEVMRVSEG